MSTVQFFADTLDQMDLALEQLLVRDRNFDRFAIMLVDNAIELALHRRAEEAQRENRYRLSPRYDDKKIAAALGKGFDGKVRFAQSIGWLTVEQGSVIRSLHEIRNEAYHQGIRHERILHSLAAFYFRIACQGFASYPSDSWSSSSSDRISSRAHKYIGNASSGVASKLRFKQAGNSSITVPWWRTIG